MIAVCVCIESAFCCTPGCMKPTFSSASGRVLHCLICFKTAQFSQNIGNNSQPLAPIKMTYDEWQMYTHEYLIKHLNKLKMQNVLLLLLIIIIGVLTFRVHLCFELLLIYDPNLHTDTHTHSRHPTQIHKHP